MITIRINQVNIQSSALVNAQRPDHLTIGNYSFCESAMSDREVPNRVGVCAVFHASLEKERELRAGLKRGEFSMLGQPRVDALNGTVLSVEALVRWEHPSKGLLSPPEFIDLAEETGLVVGLGKLIIEQVYAHITDGKKSPPISISVSDRQFINMDMVQLISETLARHRVPPTLIQLEANESE